MAAYRAKKVDEHRKIIVKTSNEFMQLTQDETQFSVDYLSIPMDNYLLSIGVCMKDVNVKRVLEDNEMQLRAKLDPRECKETTDDIKKIYTKIIVHESEIVRTVNREDMVTFNCEKTKLYDSIEAEYGMRIHHIY